MQNSPHLGNLFVISGPSGVGKDTLVARIFNDNKILNQVKLQKSTSVTSRKPRKGEIEGRDYFYRSKENIKNMIKNNELLE
jgi:guanylate kinase